MNRVPHRRIMWVYLFAEPFLFCAWVVSLLALEDWGHWFFPSLLGGALLLAVNIIFYRWNRSRNSRSRQFLVTLSIYSIIILTVCGFVFFLLAVREGSIHGLSYGGKLAILGAISLVTAAMGTAAKWLVWALGAIWVSSRYQPKIAVRLHSSKP